ncbi:MAG: asparagine synthase-related protein [Gaiellaceae bacterium]
MSPAGGRNPFRLSPLEIASGILFGSGPGDEQPRAPRSRSPLGALEAAVLPALERRLCFVSFSGGRDSSAVLAVAVDVARRRGLPLPVPVTNVFPHAPATRETEWQERVVAHLGLDDWIRLEHDDELDVVGPVAARVLRRHGLLWPANAHFHAPLFEAAAGGSLLTGVGGDEVFGLGRWARVAAVLSRSARPTRRDVLRIGLALLPARARAVALRRRSDVPLPWLRPSARSRAVVAWTAQAAVEPLRFPARLSWWRRLRYIGVGIASLELLAAEHGVRAVHPLADPTFLAALGDLGGRWGFRSRSAAMRAVFGGLLPGALYEREAKVGFDDIFWNRHCRAFAADWGGEGVDGDLVDLDALRDIWARGEVYGHMLTLVQAAWLARDEAGSGFDRPEQEARRLLERAPAARAAELPGR